MAISRQWQLLRDFLRKTHNRDVNEYFADLEPYDETFETARKSARANSLIRPNDSQNIAAIKMLNYYFNIQQSHLKPNVYGIPVENYHEQVRFLPQICIHWRERSDIARANNRQPIRARLSVRYRDPVETEMQVRLLASKIRNIFALPIHHWTKGRKVYDYRDVEKGHTFRAYGRDKDEIKTVFNKMLQIVDDNPLNEALLSESTVERNWNAPQYVTVAGQRVKKAVQRRVGEVYFSRAELKIGGLTKDRVLVNQLKEVVDIGFIA